MARVKNVETKYIEFISKHSYSLGYTKALFRKQDEAIVKIVNELIEGGYTEEQLNDYCSVLSLIEIQKKIKEWGDKRREFKSKNPGRPKGSFNKNSYKDKLNELNITLENIKNKIEEMSNIYSSNSLKIDKIDRSVEFIFESLK